MKRNLLPELFPMIRENREVVLEVRQNSRCVGELNVTKMIENFINGAQPKSRSLTVV